MHSLGRARLRAVAEVVVVVATTLVAMRVVFALLGG
jgi:hypothetical protein